MATVRFDGAVDIDSREQVWWPLREGRTRAMGRISMRLPVRPVMPWSGTLLHWLRAFMCSHASTVITVGADGAHAALVWCRDVQRVRSDSVVRIA